MSESVAIHQPNYLPWLGYFHKMAEADHFIFLDDVQYSKNSYTNRVQIEKGEGNRWLTLPVTHRFGQSIAQVSPAKSTWARSHHDLLFNTYRQAPFFKEVMPLLKEQLFSLPEDSLARINQTLILFIAELLALECRIHVSSELKVEAESADQRLILLTKRLVPENGVYLSGKGGANYQSEEAFAQAGIRLHYLDFTHPVYPQGGEIFQPGRSILDALFHLGVEGVRSLLRDSEPGRRCHES
ncbi:MAG: WbqC family protein [Magnetococcales bacterium]|nr:WbqC family protein [Magnetococcales bacterium]